ncbi:3-isopropylmalate dehydratase, small subunit [Thermoplasmatales archaeon SCGC AB-540-F20]|nr:3-isopropylmalate dehydratase, small subunit [Thermoplasmatales archaeon SCGC AB-540-F20]
MKYGDDINTDVIIPGKYLNFTKPGELALHAMEDLDPDFFKKFTKGDVIVAGRNFGCGSSREQAAMCLKYAGVGAIVAKSFARIFYRNAINQGLPAVESLEAVDAIDNGDELLIDFDKGLIKDVTKNLRFTMQPVPEFLREIITAGGLVPWLRKNYTASFPPNR